MATATRVLLVDDERLYLDALAKVLRRRGVEVRAAYDGAAALTALAGGELDVIVLDLRMPAMDGLEVLLKIRRLDLLTPVLLLTGHADLERAAAALRAGASDVLLKPCPIDALISAIENAHERKVLAQALAEGKRQEAAGGP